MSSTFPNGSISFTSRVNLVDIIESSDINNAYSEIIAIEQSLEALSATSTGNNSYAITPSPAYTSYSTGMRLFSITDVASTGACTLNVSGLGPKAIKKNVSVALAANDILAGQVIQVVYDGTNFQLVSNITPTAAEIGAQPTITTLPIANGGTNSSTTLNNNRVMISSSGNIVEASSITANSALVSDGNGLPIASSTTSTELGYVHGVTSNIQTQLNSIFENSSNTFTNGTTTQTFTDTFCTSSALVVVAITGTPLGVWTANANSGSFTITSTVAETNSVAFTYYIIK